MTEIQRTTSAHEDFKSLVHDLDTYLAEIDGEEHAYYDQFNQIVDLKHVIIIYANEEPVGCGAFKPFNKNTVEIKRMFVKPAARGTGIALQILKELETWAKEMEYKSCILETGKRMPDAIAFYIKNGYINIENYGQYIGMENSVCFKKALFQ